METDPMRRRVFSGWLTLGVLFFCGAEQPHPRFALYLTNSSDEAEFAKKALISPPLLTQEDIVSYDWPKHALTLTDAAEKKLRKLDVGVSGKEFVIVADGQRCYAGAFWTSFSSMSCDRPVIIVSSEGPVFSIERAYPTAEFAQGEDLRGDPRILRVLTAAGKIKKP
jgi:hypothetical protein